VSWPGARQFAERYRERFGTPATYHAATAHAAMTILGQVAAQAKGDRNRIRQLLESGTWETIDGTVRFGAYDGYTHQNRHQMLVEQIQEGAFVTVWPPDLRQGNPIWPFGGWKP
jgi:branched-chain amino acid transport system substrate-binding protein